MRKSIWLVLLVLLAFCLFSTVAFAKAKKEEKVGKSTRVQKFQSIFGPEEFPEVVLPKPRPVRPTQEDFQKLLLEKKGITPEMWEMRERQEAELLDDVAMKPLDYCIIGNQQPDCCFWNLATGNPDLTCYGALGIATLTDPDNQGEGLTPCPYPIYPFEAVGVMWQVWTNDVCTLKFIPQIREADYSDGCPYPGAVICEGPLQEIYHEGGWFTGYLPLTDTLYSDTCCLYEPWFGVMVFWNSDQFYDTTYCYETAIYGRQGSASEWAPSPVFDLSGRLCQSYWGPYMEVTGDPYYGWFDMVTNGLWGGAMRVRTEGYVAAQNVCPPPQETWYFKESYDPSAPCGIPDFDQYQKPGQAFCGPTAGANSIWWFAARGDFPASWGGLAPDDVSLLIGEIATLAGTDPSFGTECDSLEAAIIQTIYDHGGWWFEETTVYAPDFWYIQKELRDCEDVILLLGFWQTTDGGSTWQRFGGHFVTLAGVDIFNLKFAFSDPALDAAEFGISAGTVCGTHDTLQDPLDHNTGITSYDFYDAAWPSESPGGFLWLPDYLATWPDFQNQNFRTEHLIYQGTYDPGYPVLVEIEQAIVVSPGIKEMTAEVTSSKAYEVENNHGGIEVFDVDLGAGLTYGLYYGSFIAGTSQSDLNCDYGDYYPARTFDPSAPPALDTFTVTGVVGDYTIYQLTANFTHRSYPGLVITKYAFGFWVPTGGAENCEYVIEDVFVLLNADSTDFLGFQTGMIFDYDIGESNACEVDFDQKHQSMWMWESLAQDTVFGLTKVPAVAGDIAITGWGLNNDGRIYDGEYFDSLKFWMESGTWQVDNLGTYDDKTLLIADNSFDFLMSQKHIEKWIKWGYGNTISPGDDLNWRQFLYDVLHQQGYFRGDVNQDRKLSLADIVYLISYLYKTGTEPYEFLDQGDVNNDDNVDVADIVYLINHLYKLGPAPIDKNRFFMQSPYVDSTHKALGIRDPGLFGETDWMNLGR